MTSFSATPTGRREGGCAGGFPPEVPIEFCDAERVTLENCKRYVCFKRPKRCSRELDAALTAVEQFHNKGVYTGIYPSPYKENFSPQGRRGEISKQVGESVSEEASRAEISAKGASRGEISERGGGRGESEKRVKQMILDEVIERLSEREREVVEEVIERIEQEERWWVKRYGCKIPEYLKAIVPFFVLYLQRVGCYDVVVKLIYGEGEYEEEVRIPIKTRFSESYKRKVAKKLEGIEFKRCTHLIIPTDMKRYRHIIGATIGDKRMFDDVNKWLRRELDRFHSEYPEIVEKMERGEISEEEFVEYLHSLSFDLRFGIPPKSNELRYLCVLEFALKRGHGSPHLHILYENVFFTVNGIRKIREIVKQHTKIIKVRRYLNVDVSGYVMKYVKKGLVVKKRRNGSKYWTSNIRKLAHASLYWITRRHMYSVSRNVQKEISEKSKEENEREQKLKDYVGIYEGVVLAEERFRSFLKENDFVSYDYYTNHVDEFHVNQFASEYWKKKIESKLKELASEWNDYLT